MRGVRFTWIRAAFWHLRPGVTSGALLECCNFPQRGGFLIFETRWRLGMPAPIPFQFSQMRTNDANLISLWSTSDSSANCGSVEKAAINGTFSMIQNFAWLFLFPRGRSSLVRAALCCLPKMSTKYANFNSHEALSKFGSNSTLFGSVPSRSELLLECQRTIPCR